MNEVTTLEISGRTIRPYSFRNIHVAARFAGHATKSLWVMLGEAGWYWVATPAECELLARAGYEYAR
jgi:hypothetical protein